MMEPNWEKAAVFTALAIFLAPLFYTRTLSLFSHLRKRTRRAPHLPWTALPTGRLHSCSATQGPFTPCQHNAGSHSAQKRCWKSETGLAVAFNRAWQVSRTQEGVRMPHCLPLSCSYVCTDARTVLSFILATAPSKKADGTWNAAAGVYGSSRLSYQTSSDTVVCHVHGAFQRIRADLTKHELECMLEGYPPWYRDHFTTWGGVRLAFPISRLHNVSQGGWIVAAGLMDWGVTSQSPLTLYRCEGEPGEPSWRGNGVVYRKAVERCLEHVARNILPLFSGDVNVKAAVEMLSYLLRAGTASGMECPGQFRETRNASRAIPDLRSSDCVFLMNSFNEFRTLDVAKGEKDKMERILLPAMAAVVHGAVEVVEYLKDVGVEFKFPDELADFDREVWLRDCVSVPVFE